MECESKCCKYKNYFSEFIIKFFKMVVIALNEQCNGTITHYEKSDMKRPIYDCINLLK